ncbi:UvrD-helicase domain-containing protein, partial [Candidatus Saccharibacteria bacterium]|nr:UvrD-helicase domain-containing protein [Candidatus Saccharibacteria bacterium]
MDILEGLNESQVEAVMTKSGPLLLLAGAGSGKTKTLTHRIAHLLANEQIWPSQILAVTFTNKAAKEMRQRLWSLTNATISAQPDRGFMPWMGTFHGICVRMLRLEGQAIDIQPNFIIYDEDDRQGLIKQVMKELAISSDKVKPRAVSAAISTAKNEMVGAEQYRETAQYPFQKTVADIYLRYETLRQQAGALDFDDLLIETVRLLRQSTETRAKYRQQFSHIFIDEYQDTNAAQYAIVKLLVNQSKNICVVGDDWQSIYSWRGADFTNILNFEKDFP